MDRKMMLLFFFAAIICNNLFAYLKFDTEIIEQSVDSDAVNFEFTFDFKNISKHSVKILEIKKSCSCTILDSDKKLYAPNAPGKIHGKLIIGDREGIFEKEIVVMTDDVLQPYIKLFLRINILKSCEIKPKLLYWRKTAKIDKKMIVLTISDPKWKILSIRCDETKFTIRDIEENDKHTIEVTPVSTKESLRDVIKIELKDNKNDSKIFAIHALIR